MVLVRRDSHRLSDSATDAGLCSEHPALADVPLGLAKLTDRHLPADAPFFFASSTDERRSKCRRAWRNKAALPRRPIDASFFMPCRKANISPGMKDEGADINRKLLLHSAPESFIRSPFRAALSPETSARKRALGCASGDMSRACITRSSPFGRESFHVCCRCEPGAALADFRVPADRARAAHAHRERAFSSVSDARRQKPLLRQKGTRFSRKPVQHTALS